MSIPSIPRLPAGLPTAGQAALHGTAAPGLPLAPSRMPAHGTASHLLERGGPLAATGSVAPRTASARLHAAFPKPSSAAGVENAQSEMVLQVLRAVRSQVAEGRIPLLLSHADPQLGRALGTAARGWMALASEVAAR